MYKLLLAKLLAYGFDKLSLTFIHSYLSQRQQKAKVGSTFTELRSILFGGPQESIVGPLLFIIYIYVLFILSDHLEFGSYADDTTPFVYGESFLNGFYIIFLKPMHRHSTFFKSIR